ncbi:hypothetical protein BvCmsJ77A_01671 [Escherichia coli]|nr:hypothetical protein BvCmsJ77A_01671 [Escherichia coli]
MLKLQRAHVVAWFACDAVRLRPLFCSHATQHDTRQHIGFRGVVVLERVFTQFSPVRLQRGTHWLKVAGNGDTGFQFPA